MCRRNGKMQSMIELASENDKDNRTDRIRGAIYGFAIGDAMGAVSEFMTSARIKKRYGRITEILGGGWLKLKPGEVTDDTQMTFCIFDAIMSYVIGKDLVGRANEDFNHSLIAEPVLFDCIKEKFIEWKRSGPKDIGCLCLNGITLLEEGSAPQYDPEALGNGSLMRALPFALVDNEEMNVEQGLMTHNNDICTSVILKYHRSMRLLLNGNLPSNINIRLQNPSGHVMNTYENAMYWTFCPETKCFRDAVEGAVNDGGDADTIAAITGSMAGALYGYENIPQEWIETLDDGVKKLLDEYADFIICREYEPYL